MTRLTRAVAAALLVGAMGALAGAPVMAAQPSADLGLADPSDQPDPAFTGDLITYFSGFANAGPDAATDVRLQVTLPAGLRFEPSHSSSNCSLSGATVSCSYASWPANAASAPNDPTIAVTATAAGMYELTFTISANERDRNTANNTQRETTTVVDPTDADLSLQLRDANARAGEEFFYDVGVFNAGPAEATNIVVTLLLPEGLDYVSGSCALSDRTLTCPWGTQPARTGSFAIFRFHAAAAGTYELTGSVTADQPDPNGANNSDAGTIVVAPVDADLAVDVPESTTQNVGYPFAFQVTVSNAGPASASGVVATIELPDGVTYSGGACASTEQTVTCSIGSLAAGGSATRTLELTGSRAGSFPVTATVTGDQPDPAGSNNSDTGTAVIEPTTDIAVSIAESADPVIAGQGLTYTTTVRNNGPSAASGVYTSVWWTPSSSRAPTIASWSVSQGTCVLELARLDCQLGSLAHGESATITVSLKPRGNGTITATAYGAGQEFDSDGLNNGDDETTTVGQK